MIASFNRDVVRHSLRCLTACPICGNRHTRPVVEQNELVVARFQQYSAIKYGGQIDEWLDYVELAVDRCPVCTHHWYRTQPDSDMLFKMYEASRPFSDSSAAPSREPTPRIAREVRRLFRLVGKPAPRLLDYGSGFGRWARAAVRAGFVVTAYEPNAGRSREKEDVPFEVVTEARLLSGRTFDLINLEQVLEHVPDPLAQLRQVSQHADRTTLVRITVPNLLRCPERGDLWRLWPFDGRRPHTMAPFEHLHGFTPKSLSVLASRTGLERASGMKLWRLYPVEQSRRYAGTMIRRLGQTLFLGRFRARPV